MRGQLLAFAGLRTAVTLVLLATLPQYDSRVFTFQDVDPYYWIGRSLTIPN